LIEAYLIDTVTLKTKTLDKWNEPTIISASIKCRIERKNRMIRDFEGNEVVSMTKVTMKDRTITPSDEITIDGSDHGILNITEQRGFSKKYLEVYIA